MKKRAHTLIYLLLILILLTPDSFSFAESDWDCIAYCQETFNAVWAGSETDIFAVGGSGKIVRYDGASWSQISSGIAQDLFAIWGSAPNDMYAAGGDLLGGALIHFDGTAWSKIEYAAPSEVYSPQLTGIWGSSASDVFTMNLSGEVFHYDGTAWSLTRMLRISLLNGIWGSSGNEVFAVGVGFYDNESAIWHYDGTAWTSMGIQYKRLNAVWGSSGSDVFAVGDQGLILHYDGASWSSLSSGTELNLYAVWGSSPSDVYVIGRGDYFERTILLHYNGSSWSPLYSGTFEPLYSISGTSASNIYMAGGRNYGVIQHYTGALWETSLYHKTTPGISGNQGLWANQNLYGIWGKSNTDVYAAGSDIMHFDGNGWTCIRKAEKHQIFFNIWGGPSGTIFFVGRDLYKPLILRYDGRSWSSMQTGFPDDYEFVSGIWGSSDNDIFAVGGSDGSVIVHYDGTSWKSMLPENKRAGDLFAVWGSSSKDVFAVGMNGTILHYDGSSWSQMESGTEYTLSGIWGTSPTEIFAVGGDILAPVMLHYDGENWSTMDIPTDKALHGVWGSSAADVYAVGSYGTILHYDGLNWNLLESGTTQVYGNIYGFSDHDIFIVGTGELLHYSDRADNETCTLKVIPSRINKLACLIKPLQLFILIGDTQAFMTSKDKPQWSTSALIPLASMPIGRRLAVVLTLINPFALEPNSELVLYFGMCSGTVEVK